MSAGDTSLSPISQRASATEQAQWTKQQELRRSIAMEPYVSRLAEIKALTQANHAKQALSELQTKSSSRRSSCSSSSNAASSTC